MQIITNKNQLPTIPGTKEHKFNLYNRLYYIQFKFKKIIYIINYIHNII